MNLTTQKESSFSNPGLALREAEVGDSRQRLALALHLSDEMLSAAQAGDWIIVEELDAERQLLLTDDIFEADSGDSPLVVQAISALIKVNQEITALAVELKNVMGVQHKNLVSHQQASRDYEVIAAAV